MAKEVLRTHCRLLDSNPKNNTGRSQNFILALFRSSTDRMAHFLPPKMSTGRSPIFISAPFRSSADRMAHFYPQNEHRTLANFLFSRFGHLSVPKRTFPFPTSAAGGLAQEVLRTHYRLLDFRAKTTQDARQFLFRRFRRFRQRPHCI